MSVLIEIEGMPVYSTIEEAFAWSKRNFDGEEVAHVHKLTSGFGYMGGTSDMGEAIEPSELPELPVPPPPPELPEPPVPIVPQDVIDIGTDIVIDRGNNSNRRGY